MDRGGGAESAEEVDARATDAFLADLARWAADARADAASRGRRQQRFLRQAAEEEATFAGVVVDVSEHGDAVVVRTASGRSHRGRIVAVGHDFLVVREPGGPPVFVALAAAASVRLRPGGRAGDTTGARPAPVEAPLAVVLAGLAGDRPTVSITTAGDTTALTGELRAVGSDVVTLRLGDETGGTAYVRLASVTELLLVDWL
jgi:hypothetical protein